MLWRGRVTVARDYAAPDFPNSVCGMSTEQAQSAHHISVTDANQHVVVKISGEVIADSTAVKLLKEGDLPPRYYIPQTDVRMDLLDPTKTSSHCPFKGDATYWSAQIDGKTHEDIVWSYPTPIPAVADIAGFLSFYDERVELTTEPVAESV